MTTLYDVPAQLIVEEIAKELKNYDEIKPPSWANYVKTGVHKERAPDQPADVWWYIRCASLLRKIYINGPIGVNRLKLKYGGKKHIGCRPYHFRKGSGAIIRNALQQLEKAGLVELRGKKGRILTNELNKILNKIIKSEN
ncbi:MAG: 30S ribosomal protein S19e [Candidatus Helarchaeota archaeon]